MPGSISAFHLAQLNVARSVAPLDSPQLADFMAQLEPINALADATPGFVWRLQTDAGDATGLRLPGEDDGILVNMSVWTSFEALRGFVYDSAHVAVMRRRREWFEKMADVFLVLWWVPAGHIPDLHEAAERLRQLAAVGPTPQAFTFREAFPPPGAAAPAARDESRIACPSG